MMIRTTTTTPKKQKVVALSVLATVILFFGTGRNKRYSLPVERACHDGKAGHPKPLIIYVAGGARTGTTYVYNLVRILLRQRDPNLISGWYEDLSYAARYASPDPPRSPVLEGGGNNDYNSWNGALDAYRDTGTTALVKVHSLSHATRLFSGCDGKGEINDESCPVNLVVHTHRDLGPQVSSIKRMGWGNPYSRKEVTDSFEYCRRRKFPIIKPVPRLSDQEWRSEKTWVTQALGLVGCHNEWKTAAGPKFAIDVRMEGTLDAGVEERIDLAKRIIAAVKKFDESPSSWTASVMDAEAAVKEADALRPLACSSWQAVNPITHLHRGHMSSNETTSPQDEEVTRRGFAAIAADPVLKKWREDKKYA